MPKVLNETQGSLHNTIRYAIMCTAKAVEEFHATAGLDNAPPMEQAQQAVMALLDGNYYTALKYATAAKVDSDQWDTFYKTLLNLSSQVNHLLKDFEKPQLWR